MNWSQTWTTSTSTRLSGASVKTQHETAARAFDSSMPVKVWIFKVKANSNSAESTQEWTPPRLSSSSTVAQILIRLAGRFLFILRLTWTKRINKPPKSGQRLIDGFSTKSAPLFQEAILRSGLLLSKAATWVYQLSNLRYQPGLASPLSWARTPSRSYNPN